MNIKIDRNIATVPTDFSWQLGLGNDHTYQRMGDCRMFRSVPFNNKIEEINFRQVGHVYDNLLSCGVKPFVELSFMPSALASGKKQDSDSYQTIFRAYQSSTRWFATSIIASNL